MKRILCLFLCLMILLTSCAQPAAQSTAPTEPPASPAAVPEPEFQQLREPRIREELEELVYDDLVELLGNTDCYIENVESVYVSTEYLEELKYNSQENIFFGFTLSELDQQFEGERYVFTLGQDGETTVRSFQPYDDTWDQVLRNVGTGSGVLLFCVTMAAITGNAAPAVSVIFAASAKTGTSLALSQGLISGAIAGISEGIRSQDFDRALKAGALAGSKSFKWCAVSGTLKTGISQVNSLRGAAENGLSLTEAAAIQRESRLPLSFIKNFHSTEEYQVYRKAGLTPRKIGGKWAYTQSVDWDFVGDPKDGRTNSQRVLDGLAPLSPDGHPYELHHIGQRQDSPLAILTDAQHHGNHGVLHKNSGQATSQIDRDLFAKEKKAFWKELLSLELSSLQPAA